MTVADMNLLHAMRGPRFSKHRRRDEDGNWIPGKCIVSDRSGLKKLMRAARRGTIPPERQLIIDTAMKSATERRHVYMTPAAIDRETQELANV